MDEQSFYVILKRLMVIVALYGSVDLFRSFMKRRHQSFLDVQSEILLGQLKVENRILEDYITERQDSFDEF